MLEYYHCFAVHTTQGDLTTPNLSNPAATPLSAAEPGLVTTTTTPISSVIPPLVNPEATGAQTASSQAQAGPSGLQQAEAGEADGASLPEGVDPSFLAALPENIR